MDDGGTSKRKRDDAPVADDGTELPPAKRTRFGDDEDDDGDEADEGFSSSALTMLTPQPINF